jgi:hypothetical protein
MMNIEICATPYELGSFELSPIICEDPSGHDKLVQDTLQELYHCLLGDVYY